MTEGTGVGVGVAGIGVGVGWTGIGVEGIVIWVGFSVGGTAVLVGTGEIVGGGADGRIVGYLSDVQAIIAMRGTKYNATDFKTLDFTMTLRCNIRHNFYHG